MQPGTREQMAKAHFRRLLQLARMDVNTASLDLPCKWQDAPA
jgi:hypothetical protein